MGDNLVVQAASNISAHSLFSMSRLGRLITASYIFVCWMITLAVHGYHATASLHHSRNSVRRAAIDTRHSHKDVTTPPERVAEVIHINESDFEGKIHLGPVDGESMDVSHGKGSSVRVIPITIFCIVTLSIVGIITRLVIVTRRINSKLAKASKIEDYDGNSMIEAKSENADDFVDEPDANSESTSAASEGTPSPLPTTPTHVNDD